MGEGEKPAEKVEMERRARWILVPTLSLLAAGCQTVDGVVSDVTLGDRVQAKAAPNRPAPNPPPSAPAPATDPPSVSVIPPARAPAKPPPMKTLEPARLMGLNYEDTTASAGKPVETREEPPATVWRYRTEDCVVDVFFYMDLATKQFRALAYDVKPSKKTAEAQRVCAEMAKPKT